MNHETIKRITRERNRILRAIYRKIDTDQGRAWKSPLLRLRKRYVISIAQLARDTGVNPRTLRKIEADEPGIVIRTDALIKLANFFGLKYWSRLVTGDR